MEFIILKILPILKDLIPWLIICGGVIKWWFSKRQTDEAAGLTRFETISRVEERLRQSLEKQLAITEVKLDLANKEIERLKLLLAKYELELKQFKEQLGANSYKKD